MAEFKGLVISLILIGMVAISMITFVSNTQNIREINNSILSNSELNRSNSLLQKEISTGFGNSSDSLGTLSQEDPRAGIDNIVFDSIAGVWKILKGNVIRTIYDTLIILPSHIIGIPPIILTGFSAIILVTIVFLVWKAVKTGV